MCLIWIWGICQMIDQLRTKAVVTVTEMARMVGLSRARFYQLVEAGVFPFPVYDVRTRRPVFTEDQQEACLEVRRRNRGINGHAVLFYAKASGQAKPVSKARPKPTTKTTEYGDVFDGLRALGLAAVTSPQVGTAIKQLFPAGLDGADRGEVIRVVFLHLKRQNSGDNAG